MKTKVILTTARLWTCYLIALAPLAAALNQPIRTTAGLVQGVPGADAGIVVFKGIPYAAPPVGDLRWQAPKAMAPWHGIRQAKEFGNSCIQNVVTERKPWTYEFMTHNSISEDCLYLNVWTPAKAADAKLPVFVYIYGGGNTEGSSAVPVYDGGGLAKKGGCMFPSTTASEYWASLPIRI